MPTFSKTSQERLATCEQDLQVLFNEVIKHFECVVICGYRSQEVQEEAFKNRTTKLHWPNSKHNSNPSQAVDVICSKNGVIDWKDYNRIYHFSGFVLGVAEVLLQQGLISHKVRFGGDWNDNTILSDETFLDLIHYELLPINP